MTRYLALIAVALITGCDQPPKSDRPEPISVTAPIGTALADVDAIPPLATNIRDDAKALTPANVPTLAPRIERNADEVIDHARAASRVLSETQAVSLKNDRLVADLQATVQKLTAANAKLAEQVERERQSGVRKVQTIVGGVSAVVILAGIGLAVAGNVKLGAIIAAAGAVGAGIAVYFATIAAAAGLVSLVGLVGGLAWLAWYAWRNRADAKSLVVANIAAMKQGALFPTPQLASVWKWEQTPGARKLVDEVQTAEGVGKLVK